MNISPWNNLSIADKATMMEVAVRNGITDLNEIRQKYNEFAKGGNLYELGGPKSNSYDKPQTFIGRVAQVLGASPHNSRDMDVVSSVAQTLPKASPAVSALDLGYDLNRAYHGEEGALADAGLDILGMLPYISKGGIKAGRGILDVVRGNEKLRKAWNISAGTAKVSDFISDTYGANETSDAKRIKRALGGNLYPYGGPKKKAFLSSLDQSLKEDNRFDNAQWRQFFTDLANMESGYSPNITNSIGAKGYFQLMPFNRAKTWNNPTQQFHEMYKLTGNNLNYLNKNLTQKDWEKAEALGIDMYGMLAGAHLGGAGNVLKALRGKGNAKDMNGTSVMGYMTKFSQKGQRPALATPSYYEEAPATMFAPSNPEVFFGGYQAPEIEAPLPFVELEETPQYSEEEIARQERREKLNNLSMLMSLTSPQGSNNSMLDAIGLLMR